MSCMLSGPFQPHSEERMDTQAVEKSKAGLHEDYFGAPPRAILGVIRYIQDMHRGVERYLERKGFNEFRQQELRNALLD
ncbi:hypothetical protein SARC_11649 [Sphaeroforma arctica JP610]|uniref:Uncharacterized protein n=1 Tax=Sphaeroforma arctica JP610 TaxID=667725 RepID=A0A0L0FH75_9EUKA|nr:hypothetical protein SARC_11649 [Sphaeroforma arctica JP610]KNC75831.1 hypothetical protein SARC_11649 [Sphaeroforma arctica JP610]|eukprot:XP_014149733.1 hypothetical protein SARC_11649 [Sphaeroforma arctica JP610]